MSNYDLDYETLLQEFDQKTKTKILKEVDRRVQEALKEEEKQLLDRKERIRMLYANEQRILATEQNFTPEEQRYNEMRRKILEVETKRERERLEIVEEKRKLQKFLNCDEIRNILSKQQDKAIKMDQWWQINEKIALSKKKANEDKFYHELILQNVKDSMRLDEECNKKKWESEIAVRKGYEEQIEHMNAQKQNRTREREKERLELQLMIQKNHEIEMEEMRKKKRKAEELASEMKKLIEREHEIREQRRKEEKAMQEQIDWIASNCKDSDKAKRKEELDSYRNYLKELTLKRKAEEQRFEAKLNELTIERDNKKDAERKKMESAREELKQSVLLGRREQLRTKNEVEKAEKLRSANEREEILSEVHNFRNELEKQNQLSNERKKEYARQLLEQMKERQKAKIREKSEELKEKKAAMIEEEKYRQELKNLVLKPPTRNQHPLHGVAMATHFVPPNFP